MSLLVALSGCPIGDDESGDSADEVGGDEAAETLGDESETDDDETDESSTDESSDGEDDGSSSDNGSFDDGSESTGDSSTDDEVGDEETTGDPPPCWDESWSGDQLPATFFFDTTEFDDQTKGSCYDAADSREWRLRFVAPSTGSFRFDTSGSDFDTTLFVHEGECGEQELACNDNYIGLSSRLHLDLEAGEVVTVTVEGADAFAEGFAKLEISEFEPAECDWTNLSPSLPKIVQGDTTGLEDHFDSACGGAGAPEKLYRFVAPGPGVYSFDTFGSSFDTVLYVWELDACGEAAPFQCNDDAGFDTGSKLLLDLEGGQKVVIGVDGFGAGDFGPFLLNVEEL
ncbi:putative lipoprotein [Plesiocystis pacifica SIR-1]|uniref:Putative lipoprotein n=1 Tax=Plesiocystis pacifica SIR-1 TaxID=391625 RepID=A6G4S8_9BACT|nr:hypothetical protein [Plesiocystis pacifica]EDM79198.1 putative lipoprotein [Plesiocystis pacifica SIR-1]